MELCAIGYQQVSPMILPKWSPISWTSLLFWAQCCNCKVVPSKGDRLSSIVCLIPMSLKGTEYPLLHRIGIIAFRWEYSNLSNKLCEIIKMCVSLCNR